MNAAIVAAVVAAFVSSLGLIANLWIARQSRKSSEKLVRLQASIKAASGSIESIQIFEQHVERLRTEARRLQFALRHSAYGIDDPEELSTRLKRFRSAFDSFFDNWAEAKGNLPEGQIDAVRILRHECHHSVDRVMREGKRLVHHLESDRSSKRVAHMAQGVAEPLDVLLNQLEVLFQYVQSTRSSYLESAILGRGGSDVDSSHLALHNSPLQADTEPQRMGPARNPVRS